MAGSKGQRVVAGPGRTSGMAVAADCDERRVDVDGGHGEERLRGRGNAASLMHVRGRVRVAASAFGLVSRVRGSSLLQTRLCTAFNKNIPHICRPFSCPLPRHPGTGWDQQRSIGAVSLIRRPVQNDMLQSTPHDRDISHTAIITHAKSHVNSLYSRLTCAQQKKRPKPA